MSSPITPLFAPFGRCISTSRIEAYRPPGANDLDTLSRCVWNICLCEALYPVLQNLEIGLRNTLHTSAAVLFGTQLWFMPPVSILNSNEQGKVTKAERDLRAKRKPIEPGRMVAELNFGFWTSLFDARYDRVLLNRPDFLKNAFPYMPRSLRTRATLSRRFNSIRELRNRVFHHERLLHRNLAQDHRDILEAMDWVNPTLRQVTQAIDRYPTVHTYTFYNDLKIVLSK
jgi:hypothetical protein